MIGSIKGQRITHIWDSVEDCYGRSWQLCDTRLEARDSEIEKSGKPTCKRCLKECAKAMKFYTDALKEMRIESDDIEWLEGIKNARNG